MPIVQIEMLEGRTQDQIRQTVKAVTDAIVNEAGANRDAVHVIVREMSKERYAVGGQLKSDV